MIPKRGSSRTRDGFVIRLHGQSHRTLHVFVRHLFSNCDDDSSETCCYIVLNSRTRVCSFCPLLHHSTNRALAHSLHPLLDLKEYIPKNSHQIDTHTASRPQSCPSESTKSHFRRLTATRKIQQTCHRHWSHPLPPRLRTSKFISG